MKHLQPSEIAEMVALEHNHTDGTISPSGEIRLAGLRTRYCHQVAAQHAPTESKPEPVERFTVEAGRSIVLDGVTVCNIFPIECLTGKRPMKPWVLDALTARCVELLNLHGFEPTI